MKVTISIEANGVRIKKQFATIDGAFAFLAEAKTAQNGDGLYNCNSLNALRDVIGDMEADKHRMTKGEWLLKLKECLSSFDTMEIKPHSTRLNYPHQLNLLMLTKDLSDAVYTEELRKKLYDEAVENKRRIENEIVQYRNYLDRRWDCAKGGFVNEDESVVNENPCVVCLRDGRTLSRDETHRLCAIVCDDVTIAECERLRNSGIGKGNGGD